MPDLLDLIPLAQESVETIRARMDADANAGLDPEDPRFIDTTEGGFWWDFTQVFALEAARLWDFASTEPVSAALIPFAAGVYLDYHGEALELPRKDASLASGAVTFTGPGGTSIPTGARVATEATDADVDPPEFTVVASGTLPTPPPTPTGLAATPAGSGGTLPAGDYYYRVSAVGANGESAAAAEVHAVAAGGAPRIDLDWADSAGATSYRVYRGSASGAEVLLASPGSSSYSDTGSASPGSALPSGTSVASLDLDVIAAVPGSAGNVPASTITILLTPIDGIRSITNPAALSGGADVEDDPAYRARLEQASSSVTGAGAVADYERWALAYPGVGHATVTPVWAGPGTVQVLVTDAQSQPLSGTLVAALQAYLDPSGGNGGGLAPIGAIVTVDTPSTQTVTVDATPTFESGFSADGAGGTTALQGDIEDAIASYFATLRPGDDVIVAKIIAAVVDVNGVANVTAVELNGVAADFTIASDEVAELTTVTLH